MMKSALVTLIPLILSIQIYGQGKTSPYMIGSNGDTLSVSKIYKKATNEDQVVFDLNGVKTTLKAATLKSYFDDGNVSSIFSHSDEAYKLVKIVLEGSIKLAQSVGTDKFAKYYVTVDDQWISLEPQSSRLYEFMAAAFDNFENAVGDQKIFYDLPSLGKAVSKYNEYKHSSYLRIGTFKYPTKNKFGLLGSIGVANININQYQPSLGQSLQTSLGFSTYFQRSRLLAFRFQAEYAHVDWQGDEWGMNLKTIHLTPLLDVLLWGSPKSLKVSTALGLTLSQDIGSEIRSPIFSIQSIGLGDLGLGFDWQLIASYKQHLEFFGSFKRLSQRTQDTGINFDEAIKFTTNQIRLGMFFYL